MTMARTALLVGLAALATAASVAVLAQTRRAGRGDAVERPGAPAAGGVAAGGLDRAAALLAASALADSAVEHYRGSFHNKAMYAPLAVSSSTLAASVCDAAGGGGALPMRAVVNGLSTKRMLFSLSAALRRLSQTTESTRIGGLGEQDSNPHCLNQEAGSSARRLACMADSCIIQRPSTFHSARLVQPARSGFGIVDGHLHGWVSPMLRSGRRGVGSAVCGPAEVVMPAVSSLCRSRRAIPSSRGPIGCGPAAVCGAARPLRPGFGRTRRCSVPGKAF